MKLTIPALILAVLAASGVSASVPAFADSKAAVQKQGAATLIIEARRGRGADDPAGDDRGRGGHGADDGPNHG
ncbi:MAG: hypothetical protein ACKVPY_15350 [Paracoccaceae bacterium]